MDKIKVAYLDYSHIFAGAERVLCAIINSIDREYIEPIIIFPYPEEHHKDYYYKNCKTKYLFKKKQFWMGSDYWKHPLRGMDFFKRTIFGIILKSVLIKEKVDVLHVNLLRVDSLMWLLPTSKTKIKIVGHFRSDEWEWMTPKKVQECCDIVLCVSDYCRDRLRSKGCFTETRTLYDSFDLNNFKTVKSKLQIRKELQLPEDTFLITSIGQLSPHKGHDNAIRAFANMVAIHPNSLLYIVGGGGNDELNRLKSIQSEYPMLKDKVRYTERQVDNIVEIYKTSDLVLSLTRYGEAFGLVPYEASIMDVPFIGPDGGAIKEFIEDKVTGLLVDTLNVDAISEKMRWVLDHDTEIKLMVEKAHKLVMERLQPSVMAENIKNVYEYILKK
ncbi:Glycosyltransferase involved in cell wall bisynthesis [Prevotella sp. khp1]|uniref:glycosyltransferase family 4 protein n=1 Tax=Prevotellaceae TaxID=171552 RepID=UPI00088BCC0B|nr:MULTISPECIES: glycosyltransferase family 4 protein [Prevotellaceae]QVJ80401.1 glycosyltransferase family 4 protein [Xylanibacter ruminicola]SDQ22589.1 Glycosyltransferase involved in cell wall bisynthesis [Prevotella sp. khp1]